MKFFALIKYAGIIAHTVQKNQIMKSGPDIGPWAPIYRHMKQKMADKERISDSDL